MSGFHRKSVWLKSIPAHIYSDAQPLCGGNCEQVQPWKSVMLVSESKSDVSHSVLVALKAGDLDVDMDDED